MPAKYRQDANEYRGLHCVIMTLYKHYSQEQLDGQFNTRQCVPGYATYFEKWEKHSGQVRKNYKICKNIFYGNHPQENLDIFPTEKPNAKTMIFIHGGYWHLLDKELFHFFAPSFLSRNFNIVFINYPLAPEASMDVMVSSCQRAIQWLHDNINQYNGDPKDMYAMGHSAGAHLTAMLLTTEHTKYLKGAILLSGIFRLEPVMLSYLNGVLSLDTDTVKKNSPVLFNSPNTCAVMLALGTNETEEFQDQSLELYTSWRTGHRAIELLTLKDRNHYSILDEIIEKDSLLASAIFLLMEK
jgi:arylformamidase